MATIGDLILNLEVRGGRNAANVFTNLRNAMTPLTNIFRNITRVMSGGILEGFRFNMMMEDMTMSFKTLTGSAKQADQLTSSIIKLAAETPLLTENLAKGAKTMLGYGVSVEDILPNLSMLGDLSNGNTENFNRLVVAFSQTTAATKLTGEEMRQYRNAGLNPLKLISEQTGESMSSLETKMRKGGISADMVKKAFLGATSEGGRFNNAMLNASKTLSGQIEKLKEYGSIFLGKVTKPITEGLRVSIIPALIEFTQRLTEGDSIINTVMDSVSGVFTSAGKIIGDVFGNMSNEMRDIIIVVGLVVAGIAPLGLAFAGLVSVVGFVVGAIGTVIGAIASISAPVWIAIGAITAITGVVAAFIAKNKDAQVGISEAFNGIVSTIQQAATWIVENFTNIKNAVMGFIDTVIETLTPAIDEIVASFAKFDINTIVMSFNELKGSIGPVLEILGMLGAVLVGTLIGAITGIVNALDNFVAMLLNAVGVVSSAIGLIWNILTLNFEGIKESWNSLWSNMEGVFGNAIQTIIDLIGGFINGFVAFFQGLYETLVGGSIIPDMVNAIIEWFNTLVSFVTGIVQGFVNIVTTLFNAMKNNASNVFNAMKAVITTVINVIKTVITTGFNAAKTIVTSVVNAIKSVVTSGFNAVRSIISSVINSIKSVISSGFNAARSIVSSVINSIRSTVSSGFNSARSTISSAVNSARSALSSAFNSMRSTVSSVVSSVTSKVNTLRSKFSSAVSGAVSAIKGAASRMFSAGANLVGNLIRGVTSKIGQFKAKISELANAAKQFLGFSSPTEKGPGRTADKWIPNLINMMNKQLLQGVSTFSKAGAKLSSALQRSTMSTIETNVNTRIPNAVTPAPTNVMFKIDASHMDVDQLGRMLVSKFRSYGIRSQTE